MKKNKNRNMKQIRFKPFYEAVMLVCPLEFKNLVNTNKIGSNKNMNGDVYGFVRYSKVRDVDKLLKALNNVYFGQYHVCTKLARFDKRGPKVGEAVRVREGEGGWVEGKVIVDGGRGVTTVRKRELEGEKRVRGAGEKEEADLRVKKGWEGEMRVGSVVLKMGRKERLVEGDGGKVEEVGLRKSDRNLSTNMQTTAQKFVRRYRPCGEDIMWASKGLIGTVVNGESIPII